MRYRYTWTEREWHEAIALASRTRRRGTPLNGMTYAVLLVPMVGAVGDVAGTIRRSGQFTRQSAIVPLLLVLFSVLTAALLLLTRWRVRNRLRSKQGMSAVEHEAIFQEAGWRIAPEEETTDKSLRPWSDLQESRYGTGVVVLMRPDGFDAIPTRDLTPEQAGHLQRLVARKLRPAA